MKQEASFFENHEPILIYIAKKLRDAKRLESVLTEAGVDYDVEPIGQRELLERNVDGSGTWLAVRQ